MDEDEGGGGRKRGGRGRGDAGRDLRVAGEREECGAFIETIEEGAVVE